MNVLHFLKASPYSESDVRNLAEEVYNQWTSIVFDFIPSGVTLVYVEATELSSENSFQYTYQPASPQSGAVNDALLPNSVTLAIKFGSGLTGRSRRGRLYLVGLGEASVTGNAIAQIAADNLVGAVVDAIEAIEAAQQVEHVVVSYCGDGAWRTSALVTPISSYAVVDLNVDSQRRRLTGRGM
jgi:hypothetical protein